MGGRGTGERNNRDEGWNGKVEDRTGEGGKGKNGEQKRKVKRRDEGKEQERDRVGEEREGRGTRRIERREIKRGNWKIKERTGKERERTVSGESKMSETVDEGKESGRAGAKRERRIEKMRDGKARRDER